MCVNTLLMNSTRGNRILFDLVKSLSKSEKRYFKMYITRNSLGENSVNIRLFSAIDKQRKFDEEELKASFKGETFLENFSVAKNRLTENIINSLQFFHSKKTAENKLNSLLNEIEILYNKSLLELCQKKISQGRKLALKEELNAHLIQFIEWESKVSNLDSYPKNENNWSEDYSKAVEKLNVKAEILSIKNAVFKQIYNVKKKTHSFESELKSLDKLKENQDLCRKCKLMLYQTYSAIYFHLQKFDTSISNAENALKLIEHKDLESRVSSLGNIVFLAVQIGQYDKAKTHLFNLQHIKKEENISPSIEAKLFENISSLSLLIKSSEKKIEDAIKIIPPIAEKLRQYNGQISSLKRASFYLNFAQLHFLKGDLKEALKWSNELLNYPKLNFSPVVYSQGLMLNLLIHLELSNFNILDSKLKSVERYLRKNKLFHSFEKLFIQQLSNAKKKEINFAEWKEELSSIHEKEMKFSFNRNFHFEKWLEAKTKNLEMIYLI